MIDKAVYTDPATGRMLPGLSADAAGDIQRKIDAGELSPETKVASSIPFMFYRNRNAFLRTFDEQYWKTSPYDEWTETRSFNPSQI